MPATVPPGMTCVICGSHFRPGSCAIILDGKGPAHTACFDIQRMQEREKLEAQPDLWQELAQKLHHLQCRLDDLEKYKRTHPGPLEVFGVIAGCIGLVTFTLGAISLFVRWISCS